MIEYINLGLFIISYFGFGYFYLISIQPKKRELIRGQKAWKECQNFRIYYSMPFLLLWIISLFLWLKYPIETLNWKVSNSNTTALILSIIISIPFVIIMLKGEKDAGKETLMPSSETKMYGGIYKYIRHPQTLGEFPTFITLSMMVNSWFLTIISLTFVIVYTPIMIYYEEKDLVLRFGDSYKEYQKKTGALLPKFNSKR
jgi:protein-S-isoprenylcysteine O-methyltransferase Ste14